MANKKPKLPTYDPDKDGNPFYWIVQTSARCRRENINGQAMKQIRPNLDPLTGRVPHRPL
jgi:hypothetical protein